MFFKQDIVSSSKEQLVYVWLIHLGLGTMVTNSNCVLFDLIMANLKWKAVRMWFEGGGGCETTHTDMVND